MNVGGLRQRLHYIKKSVIVNLRFTGAKCKEGMEEDKFYLCSIVTANKPNGIKSRYRSILVKYMNVEVRHIQSI